MILMLAGLIAIRHSIEAGLPEALARLGVYAATIGVTVGLITVILDGVAAKQLADQWAMAPESEKTIALSVVSANETINFALAGLFNTSFAGVPFILFGLAIALSHAYPRWLGWAATAAGSGSIGAGHAHAEVLLLISLLYHYYIQQTNLSPAAKVIAAVIVLVGILAQSGGFFLHMLIGQPGAPSLGTTVTSLGAVLLAAAVLVLVYGLIITK